MKRQQFVEAVDTQRHEHRCRFVVNLYILHIIVFANEVFLTIRGQGWQWHFLIGKQFFNYLLAHRFPCFGVHFSRFRISQTDLNLSYDFRRLIHLLLELEIHQAQIVPLRGWRFRLRRQSDSGFALVCIEWYFTRYWLTWFRIIILDIIQCQF